MIVSVLSLLLQGAQPYEPVCNQEAADRGIQQEMNICAMTEYRAADANLNAQWKITSSKMKARDDGWTPDWDDRPGYFASLLEGQRAWIAYRDAHCRTDGYAARGGSLEPLLVSTCKTTLTKARTEELRALADGPE
ncbi:lysozyme inhibitor LprI family protein [Erythrobacter sp. MTPC3]|uniref:lysozyme inhibitor LprI family protein n=1 Tax=Erythrobacter sp. MTPC3 TaxID=3056564 RepID=UPI0036F2A20B